MTTRTEQLLQDFLNLPDQERWEFIESAMGVLGRDDGVDLDDPQWQAEMHRRAADVHEGRVQGEPADAVYARAREELRRRP